MGNWDKKRRRGKNMNSILVDGKYDAIISDNFVMPKTIFVR
jgi:hypothetical protein